jgi:site-specific DNA recombinase
MRELKSCGISSGIKVTRRGNTLGGQPFSLTGLRHLLGNPVYVGEIRHKRDCYPGQHEPIVTPEMWAQVQEKRRSFTVRIGEGQNVQVLKSPLAGKLFDDSGVPLYVRGGTKGGCVYRYYVSKRLAFGRSPDDETAWSVSAPKIESIVCSAAVNLLRDQGAIEQALKESRIDGHRLPSVLRSAKTWLERLGSESESKLALSRLIDRIDLKSDAIQVTLKLPVPENDRDDGENPAHLSLSRIVPMQMKRRGVEMRFVLAGDAISSRVDLPLLTAVARGRKWSQDLIYRRVSSIGELATREGLDRRSIRRLLRLGFLSPRIVEAIAEGRQPPDLTVIMRTGRIERFLSWSAQQEALGFR